MVRLPQAELKLGELCNNRCVFCISGHLTSRKQAPLVSTEALLAELASARRAGVKRITLLGGEPTIQPAFRALVKGAVALGFEQIVIFSNGSRLGHTALMDEVLETGGAFEWRFSLQGATREAHERTTRRKGSFDGVMSSLARADARSQQISVNMCVVKQNYESIPAFAELLAPFRIAQLHLDMLHPSELPDERKADLAGLMPRYSDLIEPLSSLLSALPPTFDLCIGNLPLCIAPQLAPWIFHGGEKTWVLRVGEAADKWRDKDGAKTKLPRCAGCAAESRCGGVYRAYLETHGDGEIAPVAGSALELAARLGSLRRRAPFGRLAWTHVIPEADQLVLGFASPEGERVELWLKSDGTGGYRLTDPSRPPSADVVEGLEALMHALGLLR